MTYFTIFAFLLYSTRKKYLGWKFFKRRTAKQLLNFWEKKIRGSGLVLEALQTFWPSTKNKTLQAQNFTNHHILCITENKLEVFFVSQKWKQCNKTAVNSLFEVFRQVGISGTTNPEAQYYKNYLKYFLPRGKKISFSFIGENSINRIHSLKVSLCFSTYTYNASYRISKEILLITFPTTPRIERYHSR